MLRVDRPTALIDQPVRVTVGGLAAGQTVTVRAQASDHAKLTWTSRARFTADDRGTVDLATAAPRAGTSTAADPMGLFWSLQPPTGHDPRTTDFDWSTKDPLPITLAAETNGGRRASRRLVRLQVANGSSSAATPPPARANADSWPKLLAFIAEFGAPGRRRWAPGRTGPAVASRSGSAR